MLSNFFPPGKTSREMMINTYSSPLYLAIVAIYVAFLIWYVALDDFVSICTEPLMLTFIAQSVILGLVGWFYPIPRQTWMMLTLVNIPITLLIVYDSTKYVM